MVTPNEVDASSEIDSSPETTDSLPVEGDQPLIPADWDEQQETPAATDEVATPGDETASDDSEPQSKETSDTTEEASTAGTEELPAATTAEVTEPAEGTPSEPRTYTTDEWGKRESSYRTQQSESQKQVAELQASVTQMQQSYNDQVLDAEVRGYEQSLQQQLVADGHDEASAQRFANQQANATKAAFQAEQQSQVLRQELNQSTQAQETTARNASVERMMQTHGVPESQRHLLQGYSDPALLVEAAETLGRAETLRKQSIEARQAQVPAGGAANTFDAGSGSTGSITDDQWLETRYNEGLADSPADDARAFKILESRGMKPIF